MSSESFQQQLTEIFQNMEEGKYKEFVKYHGIQLFSSQLPIKKDLIEGLLDKIEHQVFDAGNYFSIVENHNDQLYEVKATQNIKPHQDIFLVDHFMSWKYRDLRKNLIQNPTVIPRLKNILQFQANKIKLPIKNQEEKQPNPNVIEFEGMAIEDPNDFNVQPNCVVLSFYENNIKDLNIIDDLLYKLPNLKVLYLNDNPVSEGQSFEALKKLVEMKYKNIELLNSNYTQNLTEWGVKFTTFNNDPELASKKKSNKVRYLDLSDRDVLNITNQSQFFNFPNVTNINMKNYTLDSDDKMNTFFCLLKIFKKLENIQVDTSIQSVLWDIHSQQQLTTLLPNLKMINNFSLEVGAPQQNEDDLQFIQNYIWKLANSYRLADTQQLDESSIWYLMDEFGSAIPHSDEPNVKMIPFLYMPNNKMDNQVVSYSLMWPVTDIQKDQMIYRDYLMGLDESKFRSARLACWFDVPKQLFIDFFKKDKSIDSLQLLKDFQSNFKPLELVPNLTGPVLKVFTDSKLILSSLTSANYQMVDTIEEADIIWFNQNITDYKLFDSKLINQFPFEQCIVNKENLYQTITSILGYVPFLPVTHSNLNNFVGDYFNREEKGKPNKWIVKAPNLAQSLDMYVTNNIESIIRLLETGPKILQKYIEKPVTLKGKKIDIRVQCYVRSMNPLCVYVDPLLWPRQSVNKYDTDPRNIHEFETHFTVNEKADYHYASQAFENDFNEKYAHRNVTWKQIFERIKQILQVIFKAVAIHTPEMHQDNARAYYGWDFMIDEETLQPLVLECTWSPDGRRAVKYNPDNYNEIFDTLFMDKVMERFERLF